MKGCLKIILVKLTLCFFIVACKNSGQQKNFQSEIQRGIDQYNSDSLAESVTTFSRLIRLTDTCKKCYEYRALSYHGLEKYYLALSDINSFIRLDSLQAVGYANRASINYMLHDYENALNDYRKALQLSPRSEVLYNPISHMFYAMGEKDSACVYYQKALTIGDTTFDNKIKQFCQKRNNPLTDGVFR